MKYSLIANFETSTGNINAGFVSHIEDGGMIFGDVLDENGNKVAHHLSSTLSFLESDLLRMVKFDKEKDTYTKNW